MVKKRALTGIRASGNLHIGNYLGSLKEGLNLQDAFECFFFIADLHALTTNRDPEALQSQTYDVVAAWLAFGLDAKKHCLYRQSDIPQVTELSWMLSCVTGMGLLQKAHSYKDALANDREVSHGVFAYPVLMAADILLYDADVVPVGKDQKQHVEMARDMAGSMNAAYNAELLKLPQPMVNQKVMLIPGLDGRKMSKSYGNEVALFGSEKELRSKLMSLKTDSTPLESPKELDGTLVGELFTHFATDQEYRDLKEKLARGGYGWGHAKQDLVDAILRELKDPRAKFDEIRPDLKLLDEILADGAARAWGIGEVVLDRVRTALGFPRRSVCS